MANLKIREGSPMKSNNLKKTIILAVAVVLVAVLGFAIGKGCSQAGSSGTDLSNSDPIINNTATTNQGSVDSFNNGSGEANTGSNYTDGSSTGNTGATTNDTGYSGPETIDPNSGGSGTSVTGTGNGANSNTTSGQMNGEGTGNDGDEDNDND